MTLKQKMSLWMSCIFGLKKKGFKMVLMVDLYLNVSNAYKMTTTYNLEKLVKIAN